jgi:hypothetical protein
MCGYAGYAISTEFHRELNGVLQQIGPAITSKTKTYVHFVAACRRMWRRWSCQLQMEVIQAMII